jgi:hypothetical protein
MMNYKRFVAAGAVVLSAALVTACLENLTGPSITNAVQGVSASNFRAVPNPAQAGETVRFLWSVTNSQSRGIRWTLELDSKVEGTGSMSSNCECVHTESASDLISRYGTGSHSVSLRVYDASDDRTITTLSLSLALNK